jgi:hypothetical protein
MFHMVFLQVAKEANPATKKVIASLRLERWDRDGWELKIDQVCAPKEVIPSLRLRQQVIPNLRMCFCAPLTLEGDVSSLE